MSTFKIGDRVRIKALGRFGPSPTQGLFVGNTGTVLALRPNGLLGIEVDNGEGPGLGPWHDGYWGFLPSALELIDG
jgi:hypothetical protein